MDLSEECGGVGHWKNDVYIKRDRAQSRAYTVLGRQLARLALLADCHVSTATPAVSGVSYLEFLFSGYKYQVCGIVHGYSNGKTKYIPHSTVPESSTESSFCVVLCNFSLS
jgi:hypothetical protein